MVAEDVQSHGTGQCKRRPCKMYPLSVNSRSFISDNKTCIHLLNAFYYITRLNIKKILKHPNRFCK